MAITLDGTVGVTSPDFIPSSSNIPTNGLFLPAANTVGLATGSTERLRIDSSGNLGLGVTPSGWNTLKGIQVSTTAYIAGFPSQEYASYGSNAYYASGWKYITTNVASQINCSGGGVQFQIAPSGTAGAAISFTQAMTLDASGYLQIGTTSAFSGATLSVKNAVSGTQTIAIHNAGASATNYFMSFAAGSSYSEKGYITWNGITVAIAQASDERLKENILDASSALPKIKAIKIRSFDFKENGRHVDYGVIAQELKDVVPSAVFEGIDNEDGSISKHWAVGLEPIIPILVKAIQELTARLEALENK